MLGGRAFNINIHQRWAPGHFSLRCLRTGERPSPLLNGFLSVEGRAGGGGGQKGKKNTKNCLWDGLF